MECELPTDTVLTQMYNLLKLIELYILDVHFVQIHSKGIKS